MSILSCEKLKLTLGAKHILSDVSFNIQKGSLVTILGPSGSGKSTLLKVISGLISPDSGEVIYKNKPIYEYQPTEYRKSVRYVPQSPNLFTGTVRDNLAFPYEIRKQPFVDTDSRKLLADFMLPEEYLNKQVSKLSGGEQQRVALVRSMLFTPEILLLDEPTSALDRTSRQAAEDTLLYFNKRGVTVLWITHDEKQSERVANKELHLKAGKIVSYKTRESRA